MTSTAPKDKNDQSGIRTKPYDSVSDQITLLRDVHDILEFDKAVKSVTEHWRRPIRIGSILRASEVIVENFGVKITKANKEKLREEARRRYQMDSEQTMGVSTERDSLRLLKKQHSAESLEEMSFGVAEFVREFMTAADKGKKEFHICDIASGIGRCSSRIIVALSEAPREILKRTVFHVVDRSERIILARRNLETMGARVITHQMHDEDFIRTTNHRFDAVVSVAHLHRKPYIGDYLKELREIINPGGVFVSGNWHSSMCHDPNRVYIRLIELGLGDKKFLGERDEKEEEIRLGRLNTLFGPLAKRMNLCGKNMDPDEFAAEKDHAEFLRKVAIAMDHARYEGKMRVRIIGAYTTSKQLKQKLDENGFETDVEKLRTAFPKAKLPPNLPFKPRTGTESIAITPARRIK